MGITNKFLDVAKQGMERLKEEPFQVPLTEAMLNQIAVNVLSDNEDLNSFALSLHDGWFGTNTKLKHRLGDLVIKADFEIYFFKVGHEAQIVELRQRGKVEIQANGWLSRIALVVIETVLSALFGKTRFDWQLKGLSIPSPL